MGLLARINRIGRWSVTRCQWRFWGGLILSAVVGATFAIPGVYWAVYFGGGGHGTVTPLFVLFGPVMLLVYQMVSPGSSSPLGEVWLVTGMLGLYAAYAMALAWGRRRAQGKRVVIAVLLLHYTLVAVLMVMKPYMSSFQEFTHLLGSVPPYHSCGLIEYVGLLHVAAVAFAVSSPPFSRGELRRTAVYAAFASLVCLAYGLWAIASSTR